MKKIRVGIIGCGGRVRYVAQNLLKQSPNIQVIGLSDPSLVSIKKSLKALNPEAVVYSDYRKLLAQKDIDWVMIGSWNCFHKEQTVAAFKAGKNVFCEKPLATTVEDCVAMREAWQRSGKFFNIGFTLRYSPHYRKVKELLSKGVVGDIISMEFNETIGYSHGGFIMRDWRRLQKYAGTHLLEKCSHDIDLVNWMDESRAKKVASFGGTDFFLPKNKKYVSRVGKDPFGGKAYMGWPSPFNLNPFTVKKDIIDNQVAIIEYENGVRATFHANCNAGILERRMYICGTEGALRADVTTGSIEIAKIGPGRKQYSNAEIKKLPVAASGGHGGGDEVLAKELAETMFKGTAPKAGLMDGLLSAITCFGIDKAMNDCKVVDMKALWKKAGIR